jgi:pilus assembly protein Flp/PilA
MLLSFRNFVRDESGATAVEYGLIAGLISVVAIAALQLAGERLTEVFFYIGTSLDGVSWRF